MMVRADFVAPRALEQVTNTYVRGSDEVMERVNSQTSEMRRNGGRRESRKTLCLDYC